MRLVEGDILPLKLIVHNTLSIFYLLIFVVVVSFPINLLWVVN